jgi:lycopene beta-cyclase
MDLKADLIIVGGGLAGCLTALKFAETKPDLHMVLIEETDHLGGHHTWSFHDSDLTGPGTGSYEIPAWLQPLILKSWDETSVEFPRLKKTWKGRYHTIRSEEMHKHVKAKLGDSVLLRAKAVRLSESHVELANGDVLSARCVLDARGVENIPSSASPTAEKSSAPGLGGFQKFIGIDFELESTHGLKSPLIMDATCPQLDGFRFFYLLPWDEKRLMVEETYYSDTPELNHERIQRSIRSYVERRGWKIAKSGREESGVLPIPMTSEYIASSVGGEALPIGMRGGFYHATTGYSLPDAVRVAEFLSSLTDLTTQTARTGLIKFRRPFLSRQRFYRLLNRLLFYASEPSLRYAVLQHFFEQTQDVVERFYAGRTTWSDRLRILSGRPPVPLDRALRSLTESSVQTWATARSSATALAAKPTPPAKDEKSEEVKAPKTKKPRRPERNTEP